MDFPTFFQTSTGKHRDSYQQDLAKSQCDSRRISIPTGMGKTAAVIYVWLWNPAPFGITSHPIEAISLMARH